MTVRDNIKRIREEKGMTQQQVADACGVSRALIAQIECKSKGRLMEFPIELAKVLGCKIKDFYQNCE